MLQMKRAALVVLLLLGFSPLWAQVRQIKGTVTGNEDARPLPGVTVLNRNSGARTLTGSSGTFLIDAATGHVLEFSFVGFGTLTQTVGAGETMSVTLTRTTGQMEGVVVTALGVRRPKRETGYATSIVEGEDVAATQRDNLLTALAGRVPGVSITQTSGLPGSSTSIILRGINSLSGNNQPLFVVDGLPVDNQTFNSNNLVVQGGNRTVDFSNRIADINPEDIESLTILKGPEAAALYGIDAANGAIIITTKKGKAGQGNISYTFNYGIEQVGRLPEIPRVYSRGSNGLEANVFTYFGPKYAPGTTFFDNQTGFIQNGRVAKHNISLDGGSEKITYRLSSGYSTTQGVVPNTKYDRLNVSLNTNAQLFPRLKTEANLQYIHSYNDKVSKGANSFYLAMLSWPADDDMRNYLQPNGSRRRITAGTELENPFFDVEKNILNDRTNRFITNLGMVYDVAPWLDLTGRVGADVYGTNNFILYHPESNRAGGTTGGSIDQSQQNVRNITLQYFATARKSFLSDRFQSTLRVGSSVYDWNSTVYSVRGERFLEPNFKSLNNTDPASQRQVTYDNRKRLVGLYGELNLSWNRLAYLTVTGRNDWSSTLPKNNNSFFYPAASLSFIVNELFEDKAIGPMNFFKLRLSAAQVGKDARPYSLYPALESQTSTGGGYAYGFTAPNPFLRPEKVTSNEIGAEMQFLGNRIGLDVAAYKTRSVDQIINGLRISYGTGFILKNVNGGELENSGVEVLLRGTPVRNKDFTWDVSVNYTKTNSKLLKLGEGVPEYYDSDTWLFGNVRNGARVGGPLTSFTARFTFERNAAGDILINPSTGLPLQVDNASWPVVGDRNPDFMAGLNNQMTYRNLSFSFLWDFRKGGDVYNGTGLYLYSRGLHPASLQGREEGVVFPGVLKDGLHNSGNPTRNNIEVNPYYNNAFYITSLLDQEFIERDVNWARLREVSLSYQIPANLVRRSRVFRGASLGITGTDLFMRTNYTGGDPSSNGVTAATGGSGGAGFDYGNLPVSKRFNFTLRTNF